MYLYMTIYLGWAHTLTFLMHGLVGIWEGQSFVNKKVYVAPQSNPFLARAVRIPIIETLRAVCMVCISVWYVWYVGIYACICV